MFFLAASGFAADDNSQGLLLVVNGTADHEADLISDFVCFVPEGALLLPSPVRSTDDIKGSFLQQPVFFLLSLWQWLMSSEIVPEIREKNSTGFALPEWPTSTPESTLRLSGGGFPPDPPPPPFMLGIPGKGLFNTPDWQLDYLSALLRIGQWLKQWFYNGYRSTTGQSGQFVSDTDLSAALAGITQKRAFNSSLFSQVPLDASELLAQLSGKGLSGHGQVHQPETVLLYPVFMLPQSDSNDFEEAQGVEYVGETCRACRNNFEESDDVVKTSCLHLFHMDCLKRWLTKEVNLKGNHFCPYCRQDQSALGDFLIQKGMQEVAHIVTEMLLERGTWPDNDEHIFLELRMAEGIDDLDIAEQVRALSPLVCLFSLQHLMSQIGAGRRTWPDDDLVIFLRLRMALDSNDPAIVEQARALKPAIFLYCVQHLVSQMQAGTGVWPEDEDSVFEMLNVALSGTDDHFFLKANVALYGSNGTIREAFRGYGNNVAIAEQASALYPLVSLYSAQHLMSQVQAGKRSWPGDPSDLLGSLWRLVNNPDPAIAEQARAIYPLANLYAIQHQVSQMRAGRETWPENDGYIHERLSIARASNELAVAEQAEALEPLVDFYSVRNLLSLRQAWGDIWPNDDSDIYTRLRSAKGSDDPAIAEQARALEPAVNFYSVQNLVSRMQKGLRTSWPEDDNNVYLRLSSAGKCTDPTIAQQARALKPFVDHHKSKSSGN
ncbi:RING-H2 finger protein [Endozoicomonas sp. 8E]|uniref:RING finger protein n=1 Tax=Endozoicomonas sp. 8E TaxID=3035692 RepID=UPI0029393770|nr:RING-H2 finger protein [Endozoicomonas sp. 8E]WOG28368.1 RING-H2 finger protein [Endozoicomonas sp. 8E]